MIIYNTWLKGDIISKKLIYIFTLLFVSAVLFFIIDWGVDGFDFFTHQENKYYFQSWISIAGMLFTFIMFITTFLIYKKSDISSLKYISISFLLITIAYASIGYHTSYCKVCSDLSMCGASHSYPNYLIIISLIILLVNILVANIKNNIIFLKILSYSLIFSTFLLMIILFISIEYIETPSIIIYIYSVINLQGLVFIFPLVFIVLSFLYMRTIYKLSNTTILIFIFLFISFIPQAIHIFTCSECHTMECSEFYSLAGLLMFMAIGLLIYSISLELEKKV